MDPTRASELLGQARAEAEGKLRRLRGEAALASEDQDDASADADELVDEETDEALEELLERRLEAIERAEARLREGTYGVSPRSGSPIPDGRLEIEPWAELTVEEEQAG
jgi:RNA polymerase-binding transcription factor